MTEKENMVNLSSLLASGAYEDAIIEAKSLIEKNPDDASAYIIAAKAMGADFTWVGRAYLYGLMAGGRVGVDRTLTILQTQMMRTLKLLGTKLLEEVDWSIDRYIGK